VPRWCAPLLALALAAASPSAGAADEQLEQRVRRLENVIDSGQLAELIQRVRALEQEIRELRGEIDRQGHRLDELRERQRNLYGDLDRRLRDLELAQSGGGGDEATDEEADPESGASAAEAAENAAEQTVAEGETSGDQAADQARSADERDAYDAAFDKLKEGRYEEAVQAFRDFLEAHPNSAYADNAQYWLGESYYVTRDFDKALKAFRAVQSTYPDSAKVPDARLKMGYSLYELGRLDEAKETLQQVRAKHPESAASRLAEDRILKIEREREDTGSR
jgi:tol-pal system protein YbgF